MTEFKAPLRDIRFVRDELLDFPGLWAKLPGCEEITPDMTEAILEELGKFCENELAPLNQRGDEQGCRLEGTEVKTPDGFKEAYQLFVESGWPALATSPEYGGQGLPHSLGMVMNELLGTANWSWSMYPLLSHGAKVSLEAHGDDALKATYLTKLSEGQWTGTMCLTEPHCGTDLGLLRTKAEPQADGSYHLTGTKIFISSGEHDMAENIVHLVIARTPDAPEGTKGISLFLVPKFLPNDDGSLGERNKVTCGSLEEKMGIHGNATCVLNFDGAKGFLVGELNKGLNHMFTMMNSARLGVALQGLAHLELGLQNATAYARDRLQSRSLSGVKNPNGNADPIIVHPDVRRMLLTTKALAEGSRMLGHYCAQLLDIEAHAPDQADREEADKLLALMTPIAKGFMTEVGFEGANLAMQVFGGHGYIREWGVEQNVRDARIAMIYEGTNGIQALDLLGRKVLKDQGQTLRIFTKKIHKYCEAQAGNSAMSEFVEPLNRLNKEWGDLTMHVGTRAMKNMDELGGASFDYLMYSGYVTLAWFWARAAEVATRKLEEGTSDEDFYRAKLQTAQFYFRRILPRTLTLAETIKDGVDSLMALDESQFAR
ncbi:acyl-CoA dehydrogenase C-terminal domain-containing protein [Gilvimarinus sp. F26214L]|uniref:acyl-CoA dehydrogenase C-terminal domain-containing protein n=1 Tax=Gilvimarinus sp. DZF01 TaxID=3461371 RepID=UPI0040456FC1